MYFYIYIVLLELDAFPIYRLVMLRQDMGMIDVGKKPDSLRTATAQALVFVNPAIIDKIKDGNSPKGNIFEAAKISATIGVKKHPN